MNLIITRLLSFLITVMMIFLPAKAPEIAVMSVTVENPSNKMTVEVVTDSINCVWTVKSSNESVMRVDTNSLKPDFFANEMNQRFNFTAISRGTVTLEFVATDIKGNPLDGEFTLICKVNKDLSIEVILPESVLTLSKVAA